MGGKKSKSKGKRGEREIVNILNRFFKTNEFQRVPMSGAFSTINEQLDKNLLDKVTGDVLVPDWFPANIEVKFYKKTLTLDQVLTNELNYDFKEWLKQIERENELSGKRIVLMFRANREIWKVVDTVEYKGINKIEFEYNDEKYFIYSINAWLKKLKGEIR